MGIRVTGFDTPIGGLSWEYTANAKNGIQDLFYFLESKRILTNPMEMEIKSWCEEAAIEIKGKIVEIMSGYNFDGNSIHHLRLMIDACNAFLDKLANVDIQGIIYKNDKGDWEDIAFSRAMKELRKKFKDIISLFESAYELQFNKAIPDEY